MNSWKGVGHSGTMCWDLAGDRRNIEAIPGYDLVHHASDDRIGNTYPGVVGVGVREVGACDSHESYARRLRPLWGKWSVAVH